jgi:hypothetical protein
MEKGLYLTGPAAEDFRHPIPEAANVAGDGFSKRETADTGAGLVSENAHQGMVANLGSPPTRAA